MAEVSRRNADPRRRLALRVAQLCSAVRDILNARRVSVLLYDDASQSVSPFVSDEPGDERLAELARKWATISLDEFPATATALREERPVVIEDAQRDDRLPPGLAADFGTTSLHLEPLVAASPVGILVIEPASAAQSGDLQSIVPLVAASVARAPAPRAPVASAATGQSEFLLELMGAAASQSALDDVLATICERLARQLAARRAWAFLAEDGRIAPRIARDADGELDAETAEQFKSATIPLPLVEEVAESSEPVQAQDPGSPLIAGWWVENFGMASALGVPIGRRGHVIGVLVLDDPMPRQFSAEEVSLAAAALERLVPIIERAREIEQRTLRLEAATAIRRLLEEGARARSLEEAGEALARVTKEALGVEHASVFLADDEERINYVGIDLPERFAAVAQERLIGVSARDFRLWRRATRQAKPIFVQDAKQSQLIPAELVTLLGLRSYVAFPLLSGDRPLGLVVCSETREHRVWTAEERRLVTQLALEGSLVVENAMLRAVERERIDELARQAFHDPLTGLPNRSLFDDRLAHALARLRRQHQSVAVMLLDLDGFKAVNDNFGHGAGDQLLIAVGHRLQACLRPADTIARLGGDEFTILLEDITHLREAIRVAERIEDALRIPFVLDGDQTSITVSIGIALNTEGRAEPDDLVRDADAAMYKAKRAGKARYEVFEPENSIDEMEGEADISVRRSSIARGGPPGSPGIAGDGQDRTPRADRTD
jgi:diguanylate cyclase (GGDEF)-like protein